MQHAADRPRVAGLADHGDPLPRPDPLPLVDERRHLQVREEVAAVLALTVDFQVVAVEDRVVAGPPNLAGDGRDDLDPAAGEDVEAFVDAAARARRAEFAYRAPFAVRALNREDVGEEGNAAVAAAERVVRIGCDGRGVGREEEKGDEGRALQRRALRAQWCSITRSTMWYSFASSALMK